MTSQSIVTKKRSWTLWDRLGAAGLASSLLLAGGCSSSGSAGPGTTDSDVVAAANAAVDRDRQGTDRALPDTGPVPLPDQNIWVISCLEAGEGCAGPAAGAEEAGELLGWDMTVFDGKGSAFTWAEGIRSAIADDADGIILVAVDCVAVKGALDEANAAEIELYGVYSFDCDDPLLEEVGDARFDAQVAYEGGDTWLERVEDVYVKAMSNYAIAETGGEAKVIQFVEDDLLAAKHVYTAFARHLKPCGGCEIVAQVPFTLDDLATGRLQEKASTVLTQHPEATVVSAPYDTTLALGVSQAVVSSGRDDEIVVIGSEGLSANLGFIDGGKGQDMVAGAPVRWVGWAAIDGMNRLLQGEPQVDAGIGHQILDSSSSSLPTVTSFYDGNIDPEGRPKQDYEANYRRIWGVS